jgi:uncharacterized protein (DUF2236 family)
MATQSIARVNAIHAKIEGTDQQGQPYKANEPDLLRWVHLIETMSFLNAYQHLAIRPLCLADCNCYVVEMNKVGQMLGATHLPNTLHELQQAIAQYESVLTFDQRTRETLQSIENYSVGYTERPFFHLILKSSFDIVPHWLLQKLQRTPAGCLQTSARRVALQIASQPVQWMLDEQGVSAVAKARMLG